MCFCLYGNSAISRIQSEAYLPSNQDSENMAEPEVEPSEIRHRRKSWFLWRRRKGRTKEETGDHEQTRNDSEVKLTSRKNSIFRELSFSPGAARRLFGSRFLPYVSRFGEREVGSRPPYSHPLSLDIICHDEYSVCSAFWGVDEESDSEKDSAFARNYGCDDNDFASLRDETSNSCSIDQQT